jgi:hypothetical protein
MSRLPASTHACTYLLRPCSCAIPQLGYSIASVRSPVHGYASIAIPIPATGPGFFALGFLRSRGDGGRQRQRLRVPQLSRCGVLALTGHLSVLYLSGKYELNVVWWRLTPNNLSHGPCGSPSINKTLFYIYHHAPSRPRAEPGVPVLRMACFCVLYRN